MPPALRRLKYSPTMTSTANAITICVMTLLTIGPRNGMKCSGSVTSPTTNEITAMTIAMMSVGTKRFVAIWNDSRIDENPAAGR